MRYRSLNICRRSTFKLPANHLAQLRDQIEGPLHLGRQRLGHCGSPTLADTFNQTKQRNQVILIALFQILMQKDHYHPQQKTGCDDNNHVYQRGLRQPCLTGGIGKAPDRLRHSYAVEHVSTCGTPYCHHWNRTLGNHLLQLKGSPGIHSGNFLGKQLKRERYQGRSGKSSGDTHGQRKGQVLAGSIELMYFH